MDAQEAEAVYRSVRGQLDAKQITLDKYNQRVAELKYQDNAGVWWAVSPADGSWLKWDGAEWVTTVAQAEAPAAPQPKAPVQPVSPPALQTAVAQPSDYIPPAGTQSHPSAAPSSYTGAKPPRNWPAIVSLIFALLSWGIYPYIMGIIAIVLAVLSIYLTKKKTGTIPVIAIIAIVIALASMVFDYMYLDIFVKPLFSNKM